MRLKTMSNSPFRSAIASATALTLLASMVGNTAVASDAVNIDPLTLGNTGTSICGGPNQAECTSEHATYLRPWESTSSCPASSIFDGLKYGGSCWTCPLAYSRNYFSAVTASDACQLPDTPVYEYATWQAQRDFAWNCPTGTFWDGWNTNDGSYDGACYTCDPKVVGNETVTMIRNVSGIWRDDACWGSTSWQSAPAKLTQVDGCPSNTPGKNVPDGNPFHDLTIYNGDPSDRNTRPVGLNGTCWTCPPFSDRTVFPVWESDACNTVFTWQSPNYPEPGLFAFSGATDIMAEMLEHPQDVTDAIYHGAAQLGIAPNNISAYAQSAWNEIGNTPARSKVLNSLVLLRLMENVGVYAALPTDSAEKALIDDFALYVKNRRTFVAQDSLHMYDVWKAGDDYWLQNHPNQILTAFFIGNAPPDFLRQAEDNWMALSATSLAAFGSGGAMAAAEVIDANFPNPTYPIQLTRGYAPNLSSIPRPQYANATADLADVFDSASLVEAGATEAEAAVVVGTAMAGATIIAAVGAALISISIDQFVKSQVARPQLVDSLTAAQQDVDLSTFARTAAFGTYWALGTTQPKDPSGVPLIENQCQGFVTTPGPDILMAPCLGYIKVARAARTALMTAAGQNYQPSFAAPPTISFTSPTVSPLYSKTAVPLTAHATDPFGVSSLDCTDGGLPLSLSTTSSNGGKTLDGTTLSGAAEGTHTIACGATDKWGFATPVASRPSTSVVIDKTPPVLTASYSPAPNAGGWNNSDVGVSFGCTDSVSGVATNTAASAQLVATEGMTQLSSSTSGSCTDNAGNVALAANATVMLDKTAPTISGARSPAQGNTYGWNNTDVTVTFTCGDALSGIDPNGGCTPQQILAEGANQSTTGTATDRAGNRMTTTLASINVDKTPPVVTVTGVANSAVYVRGQVPTAGCNTTDALSGVLTNATIAVTGGTVHSVGFYQASCSGASDKAGNPRNVVAGYQVIYPFTPFGRPVSLPPVFTPRTAGATAPLKFGLGGNYGLNVLASGSPTSQQVSCTTAAPIGAAAATAGTLTYDSTSQVYTYSWKTDKTWKGTCRQFTLGLDDGMAYPVLFSF